MNYNKRMKIIREENNLKQKDVACKLGLSPYTYSHYETKDTIISLEQLINFCDLFKVSVDYVLEFTDGNKYDSSTNGFNQKLICARTRKVRKDNKLTQKQLAEILNTSQSVIANYESGKTIIALPFLYTICQKYKVSADYLLGRIDEP